MPRKWTRLIKVSMRALLSALALFTFALPLFGGEIVVYNQKWTGKALMGLKESVRGKGFILLDLQNRRFTRISTGFAPYSSYQKIYRVETYPTAVFAEAGSSESVMLAVQGSTRSSETFNNWERTVFLKGKNILLSIGPSQKKQVPKTISGLRRMTRGDASTNRFERAIAVSFQEALGIGFAGPGTTLRYC